ncbi:hypothetical protein ACJX0J_038049, partial [Zea mays]
SFSWRHIKTFMTLENGFWLFLLNEAAEINVMFLFMSKILQEIENDKKHLLLLFLFPLAISENLIFGHTPEDIPHDLGGRRTWGVGSKGTCARDAAH